jgi:uncharacterized repeat protein (TIGR02543 family)
VNRPPAPPVTLGRLPAVTLALFAIAFGTPSAARAADPTLTVATSGGGAVTGPGIACPADCAEPYAIRTVRVCVHTPEMLPGQCGWVETPRPQSVTLTAQTPPGWQFTGWGGECSGTKTCTVTMDEDHSVSAAWAPVAAAPVDPSAPAPDDGVATSPADGGVTVTGVAPDAGHGAASVRAVHTAGSVRFRLDYNYERDHRAAWFTALSLHDLARHTKVRVDCHGGGCPARAGSLRHLLGHRLRPGARIAVRITHPGLTGRLVGITVGRDRRPTVGARCIDPAGGKPRPCGAE